nr:immunoglobulin light chain junction region [Macaca mulatta]MOX12801.1 immunoglobulin light chain junction region [Macaca mulatta]
DFYCQSYDSSVSAYIF